MTAGFSEKKENILFYCILFSISAILIYIMYAADATYDGGDGLTHYFISRYSWEHPRLLLDHWGKPLFTLASSLFSQFGLFGMSMFQIVCACATSYFCFRISKKTGMKFGWLLPIFICFAPIYFAVINSGLTEIFFGCVLMFSVWMIFEKHFIVAAMAASLLPFVRVDAFVTVPLIVLILLIRKQFIALAFLPVGFIIYSVIGYFYFDDALWVIHQSQNFFDEGYPGMKGEFFHYPKMYKDIWGTSLSLLLIAGIIGAIYYSFSNLIRKSQKQFFAEEIILVYGSFFACLLIHTLSYCLPGVLNNLGMTRYMVTLIPPASLIALRGLNFIVLPVKKFYFLQIAIAISFSVFILISPFNQVYYPFKINNEELAIGQMAEWMKTNNLTYPKICYFPVAFPFFYEMDPFDKNVLKSLNINEQIPSDYFPSGSLLIWDSRYGTYDGKISSGELDTLQALQLLKTFKILSNEEKILFETRVYRVK
jgi:hypothetical protein